MPLRKPRASSNITMPDANEIMKAYGDDLCPVLFQHLYDELRYVNFGVCISSDPKSSFFEERRFRRKVSLLC